MLSDGFGAEEAPSVSRRLPFIVLAVLVSAPIAAAWSSTTAGGTGTCAEATWDGRTPSARWTRDPYCEDAARFSHAHDDGVPGTPVGATADRDARVGDLDGDGDLDVGASSTDDTGWGDIDGDGTADNAGAAVAARSIPENSIEYRLYGPGAAHWGTASAAREMTTGVDWDYRVVNGTTFTTSSPGHKSLLRVQPTSDGTGVDVGASAADADRDGVPETVASAEAMNKGTVKFFNDAKGFGFAVAGSDDDGDGVADAGGDCKMAPLHGGLEGSCNVLNPRAARDNHLQGAVDVMTALRTADDDGDGAPDGVDPATAIAIGDPGTNDNFAGASCSARAAWTSCGVGGGIAIDHEGVQVAAGGGIGGYATPHGTHGTGGSMRAGDVTVFGREGDGKGCVGVAQGGSVTFACTP